MHISQKRCFKIVLSNDNYGEYCVSAQSDYLEEQHSMDVGMKLNQIMAYGFIKTIYLGIMCQPFPRLQQPALYDWSSICILKIEMAVFLSLLHLLLYLLQCSLARIEIYGFIQTYSRHYRCLAEKSVSFIQIQKRNHHIIFSSVMLCDSLWLQVLEWPTE